LKRIIHLLPILSITLLFSCDLANPIDNGFSDVGIDSIDIDGPSILEIGDTVTLSAVILPPEAGNAGLTWSSEDDSVVAVDSSGAVIARKEGTIAITAVAGDGSGVFDVHQMTVVAENDPVSVDSIEISGNTSVEQGGSLQLSVTVLPANAEDTTVTWFSSNTVYATVDSNGLVIAHSTGDLNITAVANDGSGVSDFFELTVTEIFNPPTFGNTVDHTVVHELWEGHIPETAIQQAKDRLHIGYGRTSHGTQISDGMDGLVSFANDGNLNNAYSEDLFSVTQDGTGDSLHLYDGSGYDDGPLEGNLGEYLYYDDHFGENPDWNWVDETRAFLNDPDNSDINVIMWAWCSDLKWFSSDHVEGQYLNPMAELEADYPSITFVYMTGHVDGTGPEGNTHLRNEQIRQYCEENGKWLYDFADIESWDPDGNSYIDRYVEADCSYDRGAGNWAEEWRASHTENVDWYNCVAVHSDALNGNMKAYAAWWLWARIAGWNGEV